MKLSVVFAGVFILIQHFSNPRVKNHDSLLINLCLQKEMHGLHEGLQSYYEDFTVRLYSTNRVL